tara:strand:+ start:228 stop:1007 length:780 start_codon:yes stop_codon:yes gene_type:complete
MRIFLLSIFSLFILSCNVDKEVSDFQNTSVDKNIDFNSSFFKENNIEIFYIPEVGICYIPTNLLELQSNNYREILLTDSGLEFLYDKMNVNQYNRQFIKELIYEPKYTFQQIGLNSFNKSSFNNENYMRLIISTTIGDDGDYYIFDDPIQKNHYYESLYLEEEFKEYFINNLKEFSNIEVKEWYPVEQYDIAGLPMVISYVRKSTVTDNPEDDVFVKIFEFNNNDRTHIISFSFRKSNYDEYLPIFEEIIRLFTFTNIK